MSTFEIMRFYDALSEHYEEVYGREQAIKYTVLVKEASSLIRGVIADVGCGTLMLAEFLRLRGLARNISLYIGIDVSLGMLKRAKARARELESGSKPVEVELVRGLAERLPLRSCSVNTALAITVLCGGREGLHEDSHALNQAMKELMRVSKEAVIVSVLNRQESRNLVELLSRQSKRSWRGGSDIFFVFGACLKRA